MIFSLFLSLFLFLSFSLSLFLSSYPSSFQLYKNYSSWLRKEASTTSATASRHVNHPTFVAFLHRPPRPPPRPSPPCCCPFSSSFFYFSASHSSASSSFLSSSSSPSSSVALFNFFDGIIAKTLGGCSGIAGRCLAPLAGFSRRDSSPLGDSHWKISDWTVPEAPHEIRIKETPHQRSIS